MFTALHKKKFTVKYVFTLCRDIHFLNPPSFQCTSEVPAGTSLTCRFNAIFDQHLLSWLEEYPWTKLEIALTWLTLLRCNISSAASPPWWHHISSGSSRNNPGISWLWNLRLETQSDLAFIHCLQAFLECPKSCCHLSIGEASSTDDFVYLCVETALNSCLASTNLLNLRYLLFSLFLLNMQMTPLCKLSSLSP